MARGENKPSFGSRIKRVLGMESDQERDSRQLGGKLQSNMAAKDELLGQRGELIEDMERVRARYKIKKTAHDKTVGPAKKALAREAKQILMELQQLQKKDDILESALRRHNEMIRKIEETLSLMQAQTSASADELEDIDLVHEEYIEEAKLADDVMKDVAGREYQLEDEGPSLEELEASLGLTEPEPVVTETARDEDTDELPDLDELEAPREAKATQEKPAQQKNVEEE